MTETEYYFYKKECSYHNAIVLIEGALTVFGKFAVFLRNSGHSRSGASDRNSRNWGYRIEILVNLENTIPSSRCGAISLHYSFISRLFRDVEPWGTRMKRSGMLVEKKLN